MLVFNTHYLNENIHREHVDLIYNDFSKVFDCNVVSFPTLLGVPQGLLLEPLLFNLFMNDNPIVLSCLSFLYKSVINII